MAGKINDGGPAFPSEQGTSPEGTWNQTFDPGMSLRDYFAIRALSLVPRLIRTELSYDDLAFEAYALADAMLKAREASNG